MTRRHSQSRIRRRIARGWLSHGKASSRDNLLKSIISSLKYFGPMNAEQLQRKLAVGDEYSTTTELNRTMMVEDARDWRTRRLRKATGYPDGYYIAFDINVGRD